MIPQNEFLSSLGMKAEADNSNVNFSQLCDDVSSTIEQLFCHCHCAAHALYLLNFEEMNDPCDFVQFSYYGVILLSVISYHFNGMQKKVVSVRPTQRGKNCCSGKGIKWYIAVITNDQSTDE